MCSGIFKLTCVPGQIYQSELWQSAEAVQEVPTCMRGSHVCVRKKNCMNWKWKCTEMNNELKQTSDFVSKPYTWLCSDASSIFRAPINTFQIEKLHLVGPSSLGELRSMVESRRILPPQTGGRELKEAENPGAWPHSLLLIWEQCQCQRDATGTWRKYVGLLWDSW